MKEIETQIENTAGVPFPPETPEAVEGLYLAGWRRVLHPVALPEELGTDAQGRPALHAAEVAGRSVVLARIDGRAVALEDYCPHRGARLSQGWIDPESRGFVCPYHGFQWKANGEILKIPSYDVAGMPCPSPKHWRTPSHKVIEGLGVLWICLEGEPVVPLPEVPVLSDPSLVGGAFVQSRFHTAAGRAVEGTLDTYHIAFAHRGSIGNPAEPEAPDTLVEQQGDLLYMELELDQEENLSAQGAGEAPQMGRVRVLYQQWSSPNVVFLLKTAPAGRYGILFLFRVVSTRETLVYRRIFRDYDLEKSEDEYIQLENQIDHEDRVLLERIRPAVVPVTVPFELHTVYDKPTVQYRKYMRALGFHHI